MSVHCQADDERFSFEAFTRHPFFTEVNRWIVERVIGPGRRKIVDLGCGPGAVTKLILERLGGDARNVEVIGIDPSPSALSKARAAIHSHVVKFIEGSAEWVSRIVSSADAVVFLNAIHLVPDKAQVIAEFRKTLNKDGVFAFNTTFFNGAYVDGTGAFWRRWVVRAVQVLRERGIEVKHSDHAVARQFLTPEEYSDLCVLAGFARPSGDLGRVGMTPQSRGGLGRVARAFGPRHERLAGVHRDDDLLDERHRLGLPQSPHVPQDARPGYGDHHHAGRPSFAFHGRQVHTQRVPNDDLLEGQRFPFPLSRFPGDRKSTRLNSSHLVISYAVFCLKKKKKKCQATS